MVNIEIRLIIFFAAKEALYNQQKQDWELSVAQIMNSLLPNSDLNWRKWGKPLDHSVQFSSVAQSCPTLCDPLNRSMPGLPVHHQLLEFTQIHVHRVRDAIQPSHPLSFPFSSCPQSLPASESFPMSQLFAWGGQSTGVSALALFLPKKSQDWSPSEWTGWISLQSKGLSRVFSNTTVQSINSLALSLLHSPTHIHTWPQEKP